MKGATVAVLGWLYCCCWGSWTTPFPVPWLLLAAIEADRAVEDPGAKAALGSFPSEEERPEEGEAFSPSWDLGVDWDWFAFVVLSFSTSLLPVHTDEVLCFAVGTFDPGFGIPLEDGIKLSFLAAVVLLPFGIKLAIFELFFVDVSVTWSFSSLTVFSVQTLFLSLFFSSLSFGCSKDFLLLRFLLPAFGGVNFGDTFGLLLVEPLLFTPPLKTSISPHSEKVSSSLPLSLGPELSDKGGLRAVLALTSLNFSSIDFCPDEGGFTPSEGGGLSLSEDGVGEVAGLGCFTDSMVEVALCLTFMDLLRQGLLALGEGMAETCCCPVLVGCCTFPFMPADGWGPFGESA